MRSESELDRALEDAGGLGASYPAEAAGCSIHVCTRVIEVGMIEHIECFKPKSHRQSFVQRETAAQRRVDIEELRPNECVSSQGAISSRSVYRELRWIQGVWVESQVAHGMSVKIRVVT